VSAQVDKVYEFAELSDYTWSQRVAIRSFDIACYLFLLIVGATMRWEVEGWGNYENVINSGRLPIWPFWHDRIFQSAVYFKNRGIVVITSRSKDGEYIARFIQRLGFGAIRGSSSRGGARALVEMSRAMRDGKEIAFTIDGPKGPRHVVKPGPVYLAKMTGNPILPFLVEVRNYWTVNSWDKLQIPKPFSRGVVMIAPSYDVSEDADESETGAAVERMQRDLDDLVERGRRWRELVR